MRTPDMKMGLLYVHKILSDSAPITVKEIQEALERRYDISRSRATIYDDLACIGIIYNVVQEKQERRSYYEIRSMEH